MRTEWPGTKLWHATHPIPIHTFHLIPESAAILKKATSGLYQWQYPYLPDDLCLLRADESPWLITIGHEFDSYFKLDEDELRELLRSLPVFTDMIEPAKPLI